MTELCRLGKLYGTDKYPYYTPLYNALLGHRRETVRSVLEIGIGSKGAMGHVPNYTPGASLRMWQDFFPNADILGVDNDPSVVGNWGRIRARLADQSDQASILSASDCIGRFDLVVDDGSHDPEHQERTAIALMPHMREGGIYIIEDVNTALRLPFVHSVVSTHTPGSALVGRAVVIFA